MENSFDSPSESTRLQKGESRLTAAVQVSPQEYFRKYNRFTHYFHGRPFFKIKKFLKIWENLFDSPT
jgi:hypothetical protein